MNIGIDIRVLNTKKLTGVGSYTYQAILNLVRNYPDDNFYLFSSGAKNTLSLPEIFDLKNVHHYHWPESNKLLNFKFILGQGPILSEVFGLDLDVFWLPNLNFYKFSTHCPTVLTIHDLSWLHSQSFYNLKMKLWHRLVGVKNLLNKADGVVAVSYNTQRDIMRFFTINEDKIKVIYPGVESEDMNTTKAQALLGDLNLPNKYWLYLGTLEPRKNIISLLKAFERFHKQHSDQNLILVGSLGWLYRGIWSELKNKPYIKYLGYLTGPKKDALYYLSQGLLWPSFYEGFGFPPLEALAQGVPVITSFKTSLPETLGQKVLYVDPYNVSDIYQALMQLTMDPELKASLQQKDKTFLNTWHNSTQQLREFFLSLAKDNKH